MSRWLSALLLVALAAGCATGPRAPELPLAAGEWALTGRIAVRAGDEGWHGSLHWRQRGADFRLRVSGPLGQGGFELWGDAGGVTLREADGTRTRAADADALLARAVGVDVPATGLRHWVRGRPRPGAPARIEHDPAGRPRTLIQDQWEIRYDDYRRVAGVWLPGDIRLRRDGMRVRLRVDRWSAADAHRSPPA